MLHVHTRSLSTRASAASGPDRWLGDGKGVGTHARDRPVDTRLVGDLDSGALRLVGRLGQCDGGSARERPARRPSFAWSGTDSAGRFFGGAVPPFAALRRLVVDRRLALALTGLWPPPMMPVQFDEPHLQVIGSVANWPVAWLKP